MIDTVHVIYSRNAVEKNTTVQNFIFTKSPATHSLDIIGEETCFGCEEVDTLPLNMVALRKYYNERILLANTETLTDREKLDNLFWREITWCLASGCECLSVEYDNESLWFDWVSFALKSANSYQNRCDKCSVDMPTGTLKVNTSMRIDHSAWEDSPAECSLVFLWTSRAKGLLVPDKFVEETQNIDNLPIYIDFLPALEITKPKPDEDDNGRKSNEVEQEQGTFLVPKRCGICEFDDRWRKSRCTEQINYFVSEMSEKHRQCYKVLKYLLPIMQGDDHPRINYYHVKTTVLYHSKTCADTFTGLSGCVLKILEEIRNCYATGNLHAFYLDVHGREKYKGPDSSITRHWRKKLEKLCSVSDTDTLSTFLQKMASVDPADDNNSIPSVTGSL